MSWVLTSQRYPPHNGHYAIQLSKPDNGALVVGAYYAEWPGLRLWMASRSDPSDYKNVIAWHDLPAPMPIAPAASPEPEPVPDAPSPT